MRRRVRAWMSIALLGLLSGCAAPAEDYGTVADFALIDQQGHAVTNGDLTGKVWVAAFFFTRCATVCPQVTASMARLQHDLAGESDVMLVSFSVDPRHDTPAVLNAYAERYGADPARWLFLTGPKVQVYALIQQSFLLAVEENAGADRTPGNEVTHSTRLAVVDAQGHVRGFFEGRQVDEEGRPIDDLPRLRRLVRALQREQTWLRPTDLPALNAILNATSAVLLVLGYTAIRRRRIGLHQTCMLTALAVSALFLASYLYYHFVVRGGQATPFGGPEGVRSAYLVILRSHYLLAMAAAPLAITTAYLGLRGRLVRHVRLARWTLPIWLYVSVTGVVVYWMLYQLYPPP